MPVLAATADYEDLGDGLWAAGCFRFLRFSFEDAHGAWSGLGAAGLSAQLGAGLDARLNVRLGAGLDARLNVRLGAGLDVRLDAWLGTGLNGRANGGLLYD